jgi:hypothetical protein
MLANSWEAALMAAFQEGPGSIEFVFTEFLLSVNKCNRCWRHDMLRFEAELFILNAYRAKLTLPLRSNFQYRSSLISIHVDMNTNCLNRSHLPPHFLFSTSSRPALGPTQPPIQWVTGALFPRVKRPGRESDHSPPFSAEVKKTWIYKSTPSPAFMV